MMQFLREELGTILVLFLVAAALAGAVWSMRRGRRSGRSGCGCGCDSCPSKNNCHPKK